MKKQLKSFIENKFIVNFILAVIIFNAIILGLMTYPSLNDKFGTFMSCSNTICIIIFSIEILIKLFVYGFKFFKDGFNIFDFILVAISWIPTAGIFSSLRAFRIFRALRLVVHFEKLKIIVQAIIESIPNVGWTSLLLLLLFYIFSIIATTLFGAEFNEWFGSIGQSMYSLFQIMTLESWSMGIARPVIAVFPYAWIFFVSFILISSFIVMNVIVGIVVSAISELSEQAKNEKRKENIDELQIEFKKLKEQLAVVEKLIEK